MPKELPLNAEDLHLRTLLKNVRTLRHLNENELTELINSSKRLQYSKDEIVFSEGQIGTAVYVVLDGMFTLDKYGSLLKVLNRGDLFGEIALIDEPERSKPKQKVCYFL